MTDDDPKTTEKTASVSKLAAPEPPPSSDDRPAAPSVRTSLRVPKPARWWALPAGVLGAIAAVLLVTVIVGTWEDAKSKERAEAPVQGADAAVLVVSADTDAADEAAESFDAAGDAERFGDGGEGSPEPLRDTAPPPTAAQPTTEPSPMDLHDAADEAANANASTDDRDHAAPDTRGASRDEETVEHGAAHHVEADAGGTPHDGGRAEHDASGASHDGGREAPTSMDAGGKALPILDH